jgi:hypothetical protein
MEFEKAPFWLKRKYSGPCKKCKKFRKSYMKRYPAKLKHLFVCLRKFCEWEFLNVV